MHYDKTPQISWINHLEKSVETQFTHSHKFQLLKKHWLLVDLNLHFLSEHLLVVPPDETWVGIYTLKDCYPVQETYTRNSSVTTSTRFFNLQLGISDPEVFTPPSTCQSAKPNKMAEFHCWGPSCSDVNTDPSLKSHSREFTHIINTIRSNFVDWRASFYLMHVRIRFLIKLIGMLAGSCPCYEPYPSSCLIFLLDAAVVGIWIKVHTLDIFLMFVAAASGKGLTVTEQICVSGGFRLLQTGSGSPTTGQVFCPSTASLQSSDHLLLAHTWFWCVCIWNIHSK